MSEKPYQTEIHTFHRCWEPNDPDEGIAFGNAYLESLCAVIDEIEGRADKMCTHADIALESFHAAFRQVRQELGIERKK